MIDPQRDDEDDDEMNEEIDVEKWSEYIEKYSQNAETPLSEEIKQRLLQRPIFLTRNAHYLKCKLGVYKNQATTTTTTTTTTSTSASTINGGISSKVASIDSLSSTVKKSEESTSSSIAIDATTESNNPTQADDDASIKKEPNSSSSASSSFKICYQPGETTCNYRRNSFKNARKHHQPVTKRMYDKFRKYTNKWLKENSVNPERVDEWLLGENFNSNCKTVCVKESLPRRPPYHVYYRYKVQVNVNNPAPSTLKKTNNKSAQQNDKFNKSASTCNLAKQSPTNDEPNTDIKTPTPPPSTTSSDLRPTIRSADDTVKKEPTDQTKSD